MRIGLFTNNYRPLVNGLATSVETFALALRQAGHAVSVVAPRYPGLPPIEPDILRVPGLRAPTHHAYVLPLPRWPGVARTVTALRLDVFHAQHPYLIGPAAARWARRAGRPLVFTWHTHYERYAHYVPGPSRLVGLLALRRALRFANRADLVIAPTAALAADLKTRGVRAPIEAVPTGVSLPSTFGAEARFARRRALGIEPQGPVFLSVGRLAREKNQAFLLQAFRYVRRDLPCACLLLVGDGDDRPRLLRLASGLGLGGAVRFVGAVPHEQVNIYCGAADLFLFPSTSETQGLVVLEALATGAPVVAVASQAAAELLADGAAGIMTPEDPQLFAASVVALWNAPERRRAMQAAGRAIAARFTPEVSAATLLRLYESLLEAHGRLPRPAAVSSCARERT
jgi:1,2-diacylglycerol 3-alpha-glucosyltransferase